MKNKIFTSLAVIGVALFYYFSVSAFTGNDKKLTPENATEIQSNTRDTFTNCIFNASFKVINYDWHLGSQLHVGRNLDKYRELNFNAVHSYDEIGSEVYGRVNEPELSSSQINNYKNFLDSVKDEGHLYGFFERSFLSKYCYGQRLIYEVAQNNNNQTINFGFVYQTRERGNYQMDGNRTVIHAVPATYPAAGYLCKDIYENLQHSDLFDFRQNDKGIWHIKPVMKIPTGMSPGIPVVRIEIIPFEGGEPVKEIVINTENFNDVFGNYDGRYLEKYNIPGSNQLDISGNTNSGDLNYGRGSDANWSQWDANCKVDFRVYWYGTCEVWFDKLIVDDETADYLFNPNNKQEIDSRISSEVTNFTNHGSLYTFFTDEICISQYPCIKYVVEKMRENPEIHPRFSLALTNYLHVHGLKQDYNLSYRVYLDSLKPDFIQDDHHGLLDKEDETNNGVERHENHYNQDKWTYVSNMNRK